MENQEIIRQINEGFADNDIDKILLHLTDDVTWNMIGGSSIVGKEAVRKAIDTDSIIGNPVIKIVNKIIEGDCVAVEGNIKCKNKDGGIKTCDFADFYYLKNGKVTVMTSYVIERK